MSSSRARSHQDLVWEAQHFKHSHRRNAKYIIKRTYHSRTRWRQLLRGCHMGIFDFCRLIDSRVKTTPKGNWRDIDE